MYNSNHAAVDALRQTPASLQGVTVADTSTNYQSLRNIHPPDAPPIQGKCQQRFLLVYWHLIIASMIAWMVVMFKHDACKHDTSGDCAKWTIALIMLSVTVGLNFLAMMAICCQYTFNLFGCCFDCVCGCCREYKQMWKDAM